MEAPEEVADFPEQLAEKHLPEALKDTCIVVPKRVFTWGSYNVFMLGIGMGVALGAILTEWVSRTTVALAFPISMAIAYVISRKILAKEEKKFYDAVLGSSGEESK